jgi:hypothetical protein
MSRELTSTTDTPLGGEKFSTLLTKYQIFLYSQIMTGIFRQIMSVHLAPILLISHIITILPRFNIFYTRMVTDILTHWGRGI